VFYFTQQSGITNKARLTIGTPPAAHYFSNVIY